MRDRPVPAKEGRRGGGDKPAPYEKELADMVVAAAVEVHCHLGPGLPEPAYEECLCHELGLRGIPFKRQVPLSLQYKGMNLDSGYRMDVVVAGREVVEIKCAEGITPVHEGELLTYLRLSGLRSGLIINFRSADLLKDGVRRLAL